MAGLIPQQINPEIPSKFKSYRDHQLKGILEVNAALSKGVKVVFVDADTGSGKTLLAESVRSMFNEGKSSVPYVCTTKLLQQQILNDFPYAKVLMGRGNYPTRYHADVFPTITAEDCDTESVPIDPNSPPAWIEEDLRTHGLWTLTNMREDGSKWASKCDNCGPQPLCPYIQARDTAVVSPLCVINTAYFLREANGPGRTSARELIIVDEADAFEDQILSTFMVEIPRWLRENDRFTIPATASKPEDIEAWITTTIELLQDIARDLKSSEQGYKEEWGAKKYRRRFNAVDSLVVNLTIADATDWVYEGPSNKTRKKYNKITLRPKKIGEWVHEFVWSHSKQWVLMSGSFVSMDMTALTLGLKPGEYAKVKIDYSFDPERRPIHYWPSSLPYTRKAEMNGFEVVRDIAEKLRKIMEWYPDERILVHTVSHARARDILQELKYDKRDKFSFGYEGAYMTRDEAVAEYEATPGSMLFGAGLERGYDFPHDLCRVNVIVKVPFADFSDKVVAARVNDHGQEGQAWYNMTTARSAIQMVGRGMRAADDWQVSYLLDASFEDYLRGGKRMFLTPAFKDAVRFGIPKGRTVIEGVA